MCRVKIMGGQTVYIQDTKLVACKGVFAFPAAYSINLEKELAEILQGKNSWSDREITEMGDFPKL